MTWNPTSLKGAELKSQVELHARVVVDQLSLLGLDALHDVATLTSRVEHKGEVFLTLTLPTLAQYLERGLADGQLDPHGHPAFGHMSRSDKRPRFLHGLFQRVFDSQGVLLADPSIDAVRAVRQICYLHAKLKELPTDDKVEAALAAYVETDQSLSRTDVPLELWEEFTRTSERLWGSYFSRMENFIFRDGFLSKAKHGPGAVADPLPSNQKWRNRQWTERLHQMFPATEYLHHELAYEGEDVVLHPPGTEPPARVTCVPKTAKGPRVITIEPVYNQFIQQGLLALFEEWMDIHPVVSYVFQEPNQELAKAGSRDGSYATIDLSEASDRVSLAIVKRLMKNHSLLLSAVLSCRSMTSVLPDGTTVQLRKFASMGSALTFPIETLVFATIVQMAMKRSAKRPRSSDFEERVRVYGDDIVIPRHAANECVSLLEAFGLKVNTHKSFLEGNFRESCGGDFFRGITVKTVKLRKRLPASRSDVEEVVSIVAFRNLYWQQYGETELVTFLDNWIGKLIPFPFGYPETAALVRLGIDVMPEGNDPHLQRPFVNAMIPKYKLRDDDLDGEAALLKFFWTPFQEDKKHLQLAGRPVSARLKYGRVVL